MPMPCQVLKEIKNAILLAVRSRGPQNTRILVTGLSLETGFTKKKVEEILNDLETIGLVVIEGDIVRKPGLSEAEPGDKPKTEVDKHESNI